MSRFRRKEELKPKPPNEIKYKKPWRDPNFDALRHDRKRLPLPTDQEMFAGTCNIARKMLANFGWKEWMYQFINQDGSVRPYQKGMVT